MHLLGELWRFEVSPWELVLRGTLMYWFLFVLFRFVLRRDVGSLGIADVLLVVLIADASQNAMAGGYETVGEGVLLVLVLAGWNLLLDWASFRFEAVRRFTEPPRLELIRRGRVRHDNLRRQLMPLEELRSQLRRHGIEHLGEVQAAYMEPDGEISVIRREAGRHDEPRRAHS